ncbi:MAG: chemotaxis protein CheW [Chlamydiota bacterium]|nr:chemotaxis protein CheW [Chlamydiota bacterium]
MKFVVFKLADEKYAIAVEQVREVVQFKSIISLPRSPEFIEGIIMLRKHGVAVMDLYQRLNLKAHEGVKHYEHILILRLERMIMGVLVDQVVDIIDIKESQIDFNSNIMFQKVREEVVMGIAHVDNDVLILLDFKQILNFDEKMSLEKSSSGKLNHHKE